MGSCVSSVHKRTSDSAMKMDLSFDSKNGKLVIPPSPIKEKKANGEPPINGWSSTSFRDLGIVQVSISVTLFLFSSLDMSCGRNNQMDFL